MLDWQHMLHLGTQPYFSYGSNCITALCVHLGDILSCQNSNVTFSKMTLMSALNNDYYTFVSRYTIDNLPDELIEFIMTFLPPYKDLEECMLVNKRWYRSVKNVIKSTRNNLRRAISDFNIRWQTLTPVEMAPTITKRYSHSACVHENSMYIFGGCTSSSTTFNDLWRLDLSNRQWVRPLTMGTYPSPKACATLTCYKDTLVLFGGWTYPSPYPLHQAWRLFNELHVYNITSNRWTCVNTTNPPPATAGHSVTVHGEWMILFGGLQRTNAPGPCSTSNDVWCLHLETYTWWKALTTENKPVQRYGHSQIALDEDNILIIGGCGGPNSMYHDVWLLNMSSEIWTWKNIPLRNKEWAPPQLWWDPACHVGKSIVVLSRSPDAKIVTPSYSARWNVANQLRSGQVWVPPREQSIPVELPRKKEPPIVDRDENVNGRRGRLNCRGNIPSSSSDEDIEPVIRPSTSNARNLHRIPTAAPSPQIHSLDRNPSRLDMLAFQDQRPVPNRNRERQLASLQRMEERIKNLSKRNEPNRNVEVPPRPPPENIEQHSIPKKPRRNILGMYVLDISNVLSNDAYASWIPWKKTETLEGPEMTILYTLVAGKGELIMFGGIQRDGNGPNCLLNGVDQVSNSLHFITAPKIRI